MKVKDLLQEKGREIITIGADSSIVEASSKMVQRNVGALLVEGEGGRLVGLITERDIVKILSKTECELKDLTVKDIMVKSENLLVAEPEDEIEYVMAVMIQNAVRHIPIVEKGDLTGIISIRDVVKTHVRKLKAEIHFLKEYISDKYA
ncbi:MAG: CBS domain-containing protein [Nitrospirae bacterium]|nr:MAG: CBS domain-containing protein [Nitrospirota bacterium]